MTDHGGLDALAGLDDEQRAAALSLEGPVVILAGAGTGKTRAITHRLAHGVATGAFDPRRTLAVTFTSRAAGEMRSRLRSLGVDGVQARTFHSAALRQLRYFWPSWSGTAFPELIASKARLVAEAAAHAAVAAPGGGQRDAAFVRDVTSDVEWAKVNMITGSLATVERITSAAASLGRELTVEPADLALVIARFEEIKADRHVIDFEDVLSVLAGILVERPDIRDEVQSAYRWFTVDEYQDVNPLQDMLLAQWLGERDTLCVVGDPGQTIYSFTGASPAYLLGFRERFPQATQVRLVRCYRSTPQIVGLANAITSSAASAPAGTGTLAPLMLASQCPPGPDVVVDAWADDVEEATQVASRARALIAQGTPARDIAVLFRTNAQSEALEEAFAENGIPVVLRGVERFFDRPEVRQAMTLLRGAARATGASGDLQADVAGVLSTMGWISEPPRTAGAVRERWESLSALVSLAQELAPALEGSLEGFVAELSARSEAQHAPTADGVVLASIHAAKGLEWNTVFVVGCSEGLIPLQFATTAEQREEERRLLYVAVTRAAQRLYLSWARARQPGGRASRQPSEFLVEALASSGAPAAARGAVSRRPGQAKAERKRGGPARCRICRKGLITGPERTAGRCRTCPSDIDEGLLEALREWRTVQSREREVPAYVIFTDATLMAIAEARPASDEELLSISGIGPRKLEEFGDDVLRLVTRPA